MPPLNKISEYIKIWEITKIDKNLSFTDAATLELHDYFGYKKDEINRRLRDSEKILAEEWNASFKDTKLGEKSLIRFYDHTQNEIFELMHWHYANILNGPLQYVFALDIAKRSSFNNYLDYGSGIGTGGILFATHGYKVTMADISKENLAYCRFRLAKRNLNAEFIDLKHQHIKQNTYDIITCFDVLEHTLDPLKVICKLRNSLTKHGLLILTIPFGKDENRPMHIVTNRRIANAIRASGFAYLWDLSEECSRNINRSVLVLNKSYRSLIINKIYFIYDNIPHKIKEIISKTSKKFINSINHG